MYDIPKKPEESLPGLDPRWPNRNIEILLVDDKKSFVDTLTHRLIKKGFFVSRACSGKEGIKMMRRAKYDVAILDLKTKRPDSISVLKTIQKMAVGLPVIILTGQGSGEAVEEAMAAGAFECLSKPYELEDLLDKIEAAYFVEDELIE